jgi:hypothetical protein
MKPARSAAPGIVTGPTGDRLTAAINYPLLVGLGWDRATQVLVPDRDHPLLGYPLCRVAGCALEAWDRGGLCTGCRDRFKASWTCDLDAFCAGGRRVRTGRGTDAAWSAGCPVSSDP